MILSHTMVFVCLHDTPKSLGRMLKHFLRFWGWNQDAWLEGWAQIHFGLWMTLAQLVILRINQSNISTKITNTCDGVLQYCCFSNFRKIWRINICHLPIWCFEIGVPLFTSSFPVLPIGGMILASPMTPFLNHIRVLLIPAMSNIPHFRYNIPVTCHLSINQNSAPLILTKIHVGQDDCSQDWPRLPSGKRLHNYGNITVFYG